jgi:hypothetical protein
MVADRTVKQSGETSGFEKKLKRRKYVLTKSIYLWLYSPFFNLGRFFSFLIYTQSVGLLGWGINRSQGRYLHAERHKHRINAHRHPCL